MVKCISKYDRLLKEHLGRDGVLNSHLSGKAAQAGCQKLVGLILRVEHELKILSLLLENELQHRALLFRHTTTIELAS